MSEMPFHEVVSWLVGEVSRLKIGQEYRVADRIARIQPPEMASLLRGDWTLPDYVLSKIVGSAFGLSYRITFPGELTFSRRSLPEGARSFVEPDRRNRFRQEADGLWWPVSSGLDRPPPLA